MPDAPLRDAFCVPPAPAAELRAFTHGLMPRTVPALLDAFTRDWQMRGVDAWNHVPDHWETGAESVGWWQLPERLGDAFIAPMLGAAPGTCILQPNVHWTVQALLTAPEVSARGAHLITTADAFPSVLHSLARWRDVFEWQVEVVPAAADGLVDQDAVRQAIRPDTALVVLNHVSFTTGERLPDSFLRDVANLIHAEGGLLALDGYHATGQFPISAAALEVDVYFGGLLKEGCGSSGNAYVYVRPGLDLTPRTTGWFGDADPFGFEPAPAAHPSVRRRFLGGTTAVAPLYHSVEGLRVLLDYGLSRVAAHVEALTEHAISRADGLPMNLLTPRDPARRGALLVFETPDAFALAEHLKTRHVFVDSRRNTLLRMAPFVWNDHADVDRAFDAIQEALETGVHRSVVLPNLGPVT